MVRCMTRTVSRLCPEQRDGGANSPLNSSDVVCRMVWLPRPATERMPVRFVILNTMSEPGPDQLAWTGTDRNRRIRSVKQLSDLYLWEVRRAIAMLTGIPGRLRTVQRV